MEGELASKGCNWRDNDKSVGRDEMYLSFDFLKSLSMHLYFIYRASEVVWAIWVIFSTLYYIEFLLSRNQ